MRFFFQSATHTSTFTPSAALSVAAHVALIGGAVYGAGPRAPLSPDDRTREQVYYLPPPDRIKGTETPVKIRYIEVGRGTGVSVKARESPDGRPGIRSPEQRDDPGGLTRTEVSAQPVEAGAVANDSVNSILLAEQSAMRVEGSAAPIYPPELIEQKLDGSVLTHFVIDTTGRVDVSTVEILSSAHPLFVQSVRDAIPGMRFYPASVQGHKQRQLVEQKFEFRLLPTPVSAPAEHTKATMVP